MRDSRRGLLCAGALLFVALSCPLPPQSGAPGATGPAPEPTVANAAPAADADAEVEAAVLAHLLRYRHRSGLSDGELAGLAAIIVCEARSHALDPALVLAVMHVESRFDTFAVSPKDALGLMQLLPSTGAWLAPQVGVEWQGPQTLFDPASNVRLGVAYLRQLVDRYDGNVRTALLAYNWGPGRIDRRLRRGTPLPREYAQLVFAAYSPRGSS